MLPSYAAYSARFVKAAEAAATENEAALWVDKSPVHLRWMSVISRLVPGSRFVHLLRDGRSVVASIADLVLRDAGWQLQLERRLGIPSPHDRQGVIDAVCDWWNKDIRLSAACLSSPAHTLVHYADLVGRPEPTMRNLAAFLAVDYVSAMTEPGDRAATAVGWRSIMDHMQGPFQAVYDRGLEKFEVTFDERERNRITDRLVAGGSVVDAVVGL